MEPSAPAVKPAPTGTLKAFTVVLALKSSFIPAVPVFAWLLWTALPGKRAAPNVPLAMLLALVVSVEQLAAALLMSPHASWSPLPVVRGMIWTLLLLFSI